MEFANFVRKSVILCLTLCYIISVPVLSAFHFHKAVCNHPLSDFEQIHDNRVPLKQHPFFCETCFQVNLAHAFPHFQPHIATVLPSSSYTPPLVDAQCTRIDDNCNFGRAPPSSSI